MAINSLTLDRTVLVIVQKRSPHTSLNGSPLRYLLAPNVDSHCPGPQIRWRIEKRGLASCGRVKRQNSV